MPIPDQYIPLIEAARLEGHHCLEAHGLPVELPEVAHLVEEHRWFWKPSRPRVILLAESHVFTSADDLQRTVQLDADLQPPQQYVRLIYCLGYGEPEILHTGPAVPSGGTPGFWRIFAKVAGMLVPPAARNQAQRHERRIWKVQVLQTLIGRDVWLLDASVHAIYRGALGRLPNSVTQMLHRQWWRCYGERLIVDADPKYIWVIGKSTFDRLTLGRNPIIPPDRIAGWIFQPGARGVDHNAGWAGLMADVNEG